MNSQKAKPECALFTSKPTVDQVKEDGVMKELFRKEEEARQNWEGKWGFLKNLRRLWMEEAERRGLSPTLFCNRDDRKFAPYWGESKTDDIKLRESLKISPTSSGMIGWRSSVLENDYNRLAGPLFVSRKLTADPPLSEDEPDPKKQKFIFLG